MQKFPKVFTLMGAILALAFCLASCKVNVDDEPTMYTVTVSSSIEHGKVIADKSSAEAGAKVKLTATADSGYELDSYSVKDEKSNTITVTEGTFTMPKNNVTVSATFKETAETVNQKAAAAVIAKITAIGTVEYTDESKAKIDEARTAYDALTEAQKSLVPAETLSVLTAAEASYNSQKATADKANAVIAKITAIGTVTYTSESKAKIDEARMAYNALTEAQKALVPAETLNLLTAAETKYAELKAAADSETANQNTAAAVIAKITAIGTVAYTSESKEKIDEARTAYEELTGAQKELVPAETLALLTAAESAYAEIKAAADSETANQTAANAVIAKITAIGTVAYSDESKAKIDDARKAYDALTETQKALIPAETLAVLTNAESTYGTLKAAAEQQTATYTVKIASGIANGTVTASPTSATAGTEITLTASPSTGYQFATFTVTDADGAVVTVTDNKFTMPASNVTVSATFTALPPATASYTVKHLQQNIADNNYTLKESETKTGKVGEATSANAKSYEGFTAQSVTQATIAASGTEVEIKYDRKTYTVIFDSNGGSDVSSQSLRYGATATKPADPTKTATTTTEYTFADWYSDSGLTTSFSFDTAIKEDITLYAKWTETAVIQAGSISYATTSVSKTTDSTAFTNTLTNTGDGTVTYSSSDETVATVNASTGEVTIVGAGTATITATVTDSASYTYATKTASYTVKVLSETLLTTITATGKEQASYSVENVASVSFSYTANGASSYSPTTTWGWWGYGWIATVTPADGYTITKCVFYDDKERTATDSEAPFVVETTEEDKTPQVNGTPILAYQSKGITKIEVYGYITNPITFTVKRVAKEGSGYADGSYTIAAGTTWQQFIDSGNAPACLSIGTSRIYSGKVCHDMDMSVTDCGGTLIANTADNKHVKSGDAIIDGATYACSDYLNYQDHD